MLIAWSVVPLTAQVTYEGQTVNSVELVSNPHRDVEEFRPLVKQAAGQPFSNRKVQESMAALQQTGAFTKVAVQVKSELSGLRVTFGLAGKRNPQPIREVRLRGQISYDVLRGC